MKTKVKAKVKVTAKKVAVIPIAKAPTKRPPIAKRPLSEPSVTLRQIEKANPCMAEYRAFLKQIKSNPLPSGDFADIRRPVAQPRFGPDDPITLREILATKVVKGGGPWGSSDSMNADRRVEWLLNHIGKLNHVTRRASKVYRENDSLDWYSAVRQVVENWQAKRPRRVA